MRTVLSQERLKAKSGLAWDAIKLRIDRRRVYSTTIRKLAAGLEVEPQSLLEDIEQSELAEVSSEKPEGGKKIGLAPHTWGYQAHSPRGVGAKKSGTFSLDVTWVGQISKGCVLRPRFTETHRRALRRQC